MAPPETTTATNHLTDKKTDGEQENKQLRPIISTIKNKWETIK